MGPRAAASLTSLRKLRLCRQAAALVCKTTPCRFPNVRVSRKIDATSAIGADTLGPLSPNRMPYLSCLSFRIYLCLFRVDFPGIRNSYRNACKIRVYIASVSIILLRFICSCLSPRLSASIFIVFVFIRVYISDLCVYPCLFHSASHMRQRHQNFRVILTGAPCKWYTPCRKDTITKRSNEMLRGTSRKIGSKHMTFKSILKGALC